jgi:transposase
MNIVPGAVLADKAYDSDALLMHLAAIGAKAVTPPKANRKVQRHFGRQQYRDRNLIERFFPQLKQFRRVATRYDKRVSRFESFVIIPASVQWLK